ncbi:MAG: S8 family serine peptidase, partial [Gammaproteobacteria bacterium]
ALGFWAGTWNPTSVNTTVNGVTYTQAQNFGTGTNISFTVQAGDTVSWVLEWDDPWVDSPPPSGTPNDPNDYDIVLFSSSGTPLACNQGVNINTSNGSCSYPPPPPPGPLNTPGPQPIQGSQWQNTGSSTQTVYLQIFKVAGNPGTNLKLLINSQKSNVIALNPNTPAGSIFGQSALAFPYEITVGAVPQGNTGQIESFSSRGPVSLEFPTPTIRTPKPDIVGVDCVNTTGAGGFSEPFCGTSAAAPHIAGLLALLESAYPSSGKTPFQLLRDGASDSSSPNDTFGYGLPNMMLTLSVDPVPLATSFAIPSGTITTGTAVTFTGGCLANGSSSGVSYSWSFSSSANPATSNATDPSVTFNSAGTFNVMLQCSNTQGLSNSVTQAVTVSAANNGTSGGKSGGGGMGWLAFAFLLLTQFAARRGRLRYTLRDAAVC